MKKAFLILALFAGSITLAKAQNGFQGNPEERAKMQTERLSERLKLTDDQKTKVQSIYLTQGKAVDSIRTATGPDGDRAAMFQKMQPLREASNKKIEALLTAEQKKEFTKVQEEMRARMNQPRP